MNLKKYFSSQQKSQNKLIKIPKENCNLVRILSKKEEKINKKLDNIKL